MTAQSLNAVVRMVAVVVTIAAGCSLASTVATRPPEGRSAGDVARDARECESYAKRQPRHEGEHYRACMVARGHAVNVEFDELDWVVGLMQERPHDTATVLGNVATCDQRADNAKKGDGAAVTLTPAQEASMGRGSISSNGSQFEAPQNRRNAIRVLVGCLGEHGFKVVPLVSVKGSGR